MVVNLEALVIGHVPETGVVIVRDPGKVTRYGRGVHYKLVRPGTKNRPPQYELKCSCRKPECVHIGAAQELLKYTGRNVETLLLLKDRYLSLLAQYSVLEQHHSVLSGDLQQKQQYIEAREREKQDIEEQLAGLQRQAEEGKRVSAERTRRLESEKAKIGKELEQSREERTQLEQRVNNAAQELRDANGLREMYEQEMDRLKGELDAVRVSFRQYDAHRRQEADTSVITPEEFDILKLYIPREKCNKQPNEKVSLTKRGDHHIASGTEAFMSKVAECIYVQKVSNGLSRKGEQREISCISPSGTITIDYCSRKEKCVTQLSVQTTAANLMQTYYVAQLLSQQLGIGIKEQLLIR